MCGILGVFSKNGDVGQIQRLNQCRDLLRHRGPDSCGHYKADKLYFGFRRLAIIDLTEDGSQPMSSSDGRYTVVFNGEIYNYVELRQELESRGAIFRGGSDTEVLLTLCAWHGVAGLRKLNGMFAFGLYDSLEDTLLLVRDRLGVKPLYYWQHAEGFAFSSEIRALRGLDGFPRELNREAMALYFRLGFVPEWSAIYDGVSKLPPGCWIRWHLKSGLVDGPERYWDLPPVGELENRKEEEWVDSIQALLWDATRIRLRSDVPLGLFLSGGIDSGLVASAAANYAGRLASFTIGHVGNTEDETKLAMDTARHLGLNPTIRNLDLGELSTSMASVMSHFDEPFSDTSAFPTSVVCAEARKQFTVVLSGDGGDESFAGYENHRRAWAWRYMDLIPISGRRLVGRALRSMCSSDSLSMRFSNRIGQPVGRFGLGGKLYPFQAWLDTCLRPEYHLAPERVIELYHQNLPEWNGASSIDQAQRTDLRTYMMEDILVKVDRLSMLHALEVRSPLLDYRLVELGLQVPSSLRTKNGQTKYLLRKLASRHLPKSVVAAPKRGFGIPLEPLIREVTTAEVWKSSVGRIRQTQVDPFVEGGADRLWSLAQSNSAVRSSLIRMLCFAWWCEGQ